MTVAEMVAAAAGSFAAPGILALAVILIIRGDLIPRTVHRDRVADLHARIEDMTADRDRWRTAATSALETTSRLTSGVVDLADSQVTVTRVVESLPTAEGAG